MILTYCYKIKPTQEQAEKIDYWLELLRRHWNYALFKKAGQLRSFEFSRVNHPKATIKFDGKNHCPSQQKEAVTDLFLASWLQY